MQDQRCGESLKVCPTSRRTGGDRDIDLREKAAIAGADPKQIGSAEVRGRPPVVSPSEQWWPWQGLGIATTATRAGRWGQRRLEGSTLSYRLGFAHTCEEKVAAAARQQGAGVETGITVSYRRTRSVCAGGSRFGLASGAEICATPSRSKCIRHLNMTSATRWRSIIPNDRLWITSRPSKSCRERATRPSGDSREVRAYLTARPKLAFGVDDMRTRSLRSGCFECRPSTASRPARASRLCGRRLRA